MKVRLPDGTLALRGETQLRPPESLPVPKAQELFVDRKIRGAFKPNGELLRASTRLLGFAEEPPDDIPSRLPTQDIVAECTEEVLWAGCIIKHYGHFLTECVSRLWPLLPGRELEGLPAVWTTPRKAPFIQEWWTGFGGQTRELPKHGIIRFTNMFVPESAWRLNAWLSPEVRDIHLHARAGLRASASSATHSDVLWLSRSGLAVDRLAYDEVLLEWLLRDHVKVLLPESMTLTEQIATIEQSHAVAGIEGSAFHTLLLAERLPECVYLCSDRVRVAHVAQDRLLNTNATFVHGLATLAMSSHRRYKSPGGYRVLIPETLRSLNESVLPELLDDPRLASFANPERYSGGSELDTAIAQVILDPLSMDARMKLGALFLEADSHSRCALAQYELVAELTNDYARAPLYAARILARRDRLDEAEVMAKRALKIDPHLPEATDYIA
jgi:Glycosyltransferase 61